MAHFGLHLTLVVPFIIAFIASYVGIKAVMEYMRDAGVIAVDHNKEDKPELPSGLGIVLPIAIILALSSYIFGVTSGLYTPLIKINYIFAVTLSITLLSLVGFIDDLNVRKTFVKSTGMLDKRKGVRQKYKPLLVFIASIPFVVFINSIRVETIFIPFIGFVNLGYIFPLVIVPLAVIFASNAFNLLGGFDGLATGSALILSSAFLIYAALEHNYTGLLLSAVMTGSLIPFFIFNLYRSKIIPGDSFTLAFGGAFAEIAIISNMESFALVIFIPWIIEFIWHLLKRFDVTDLGKLNDDGTFRPPYGKKIYSWTHLIMNLKRCKEWEVSAYFWIVEILFVILGFTLKMLHIVY
ncbi:MAG: phospho-N-acetylmuramoyl-pentapeptide-transferase [Candidatus Micrarchaeota archaeon]|nr:MAG: phospho-N-acetylmuramoyl-pentapeptide-transferase [Candidatus Micrarchaeota archaeon]